MQTEVIDKVIGALSDWIISRLKEENPSNLLPEITFALAGLVAARENAVTIEYENSLQSLSREQEEKNFNRALDQFAKSQPKLKL